MDRPRHSLLCRQIRRLLGGSSAIPDSVASLLDAVDAAYCEFDADRAMLERSLELSSRDLLDANTELRAFLVAFPDLVFRTDGDGKILECRGASSSDFFLERSRLYGRRIQDLPGVEARARFQEALDHVRTVGQASAFEYSLCMHDVTIHYEARFAPLARGHLLVVVRDISERRRAQAELQRSLSLVRATLESTADGLLVLDGAGRIVDSNLRFVEMWGIPDELIATRNRQRVLEFVREQLCDPGGLQFQRSSASSEPESAELLALKDGRFFEQYTRPQRVGDISVGSVCSFRDVTESRRAAAAMLQAKEAAEAANQAKSNFLANVSHELRTPITGLLAIAEILLDSSQPDAEREMLSMLRGSASALARVVDDILDFSRIETGAMELRQETLDLEHIAQGIVALMRPKAHSKGIVLACSVPPGLPGDIVGDPVRIRQTLTNLVGNAVKFTQVGSVLIEVALVRKEPDAIAVRFIVKDTGIGIPEDHLATIFESFVQVDGSSTRAYGGTGLGLSIAKRLTEMMGGRIGVESRVGEGSTFWVELRLPRRRSNSGESMLRAA